MHTLIAEGPPGCPLTVGKHGIRVAHLKEPASKALVQIMGHGFLAVLVDFSFVCPGSLDYMHETSLERL